MVMATLSVVCLEEGCQRARSASVASSHTLALEDDEPDRSSDAHIIDWISKVGSITQTQTSSRAGNQRQTNSLSQQTIQIGDVIEVKNAMIGDYRADFIQVMQISMDTPSERNFRGVPFTRTRNVFGWLPKKLNEVCMMLHFQQQNGPAPDESARLIDVKEDQIVRRRHLIITNAMFPEHSALQDMRFRQSIRGGTRALRRHIEQSGNLICRWKWMVYFGDGSAPRTLEQVFERISAQEVLDRQYLVYEEILCNRWRGGLTRGGSWIPGQDYAARGIDITDTSGTRARKTRVKNQKYTLFDAFSGAGGVSRGAQNAGFKVIHAVDKSPDVWQTYSLNFPETELHKLAIDEFITKTDDTSIRPDVLHMSPPCQYFSPAHTRPCSRDDDNKLAQLSSSALVKRLRPRLITMEQTFGLTHDRHQPHFRTLIGDLTQLGYSVRWKVVALCTWGLAQTRRRLVIIAAGPGEQLPGFPPATHSKTGGNGLRPYTTIRQVLNTIQVGDNLHNLAAAARFPTRRPRLNFDSLLGTIRASYADFYYPDGTRNFTLREYASLQGFPKAHKFRGTAVAVKRQIGNAFPPSCVKLLYKHLESWLLQQDRVEPHQPETSDVIMIDAEMPDFGISDSDSPSIMDHIIDLTREDASGAQTSIITSSPSPRPGGGRLRIDFPQGRFKVPRT
ncbi:C-5 cytosine methyltransferase [Metarhizium album ARSEF 1941]|uniref:DNA (cytosine-5-)-methyltransferase n=1 Tax=Metarhizium album (strain ARSEF 1941) TaxID=1081103 RepID=A0A0B2WYY9_METAS|nr:C-5 cytosine methyltransferase [Metarhizium album ARSEF 1941]KHN98759.1 C-5 cytosine methyltransferase [Metarhizium album ARSEF 1941]